MEIRDKVGGGGGRRRGWEVERVGEKVLLLIHCQEYKKELHAYFVWFSLIWFKKKIKKSKLKCTNKSVLDQNTVWKSWVRSYYVIRQCKKSLSEGKDTVGWCNTHLLLQLQSCTTFPPVCSPSAQGCCSRHPAAHPHVADVLHPKMTNLTIQEWWDCHKRCVHSLLNCALPTELDFLYPLMAQ